MQKKRKKKFPPLGLPVEYSIDAMTNNTIEIVIIMMMIFCVNVMSFMTVYLLMFITITFTITSFMEVLG